MHRRDWWMIPFFYFIRPLVIIDLKMIRKKIPNFMLFSNWKRNEGKKMVAGIDGTGFILVYTMSWNRVSHTWQPQFDCFIDAKRMIWQGLVCPQTTDVYTKKKKSPKMQWLPLNCGTRSNHSMKVCHTNICNNNHIPFPKPKINLDYKSSC